MISIAIRHESSWMRVVNQVGVVRRRQKEESKRFQVAFTTESENLFRGVSRMSPAHSIYLINMHRIESIRREQNFLIHSHQTSLT
jgi:hypothetical protein